MSKSVDQVMAILREKRKILEALESLVNVKNDLDRVIRESAASVGVMPMQLWEWALDQIDDDFLFPLIKPCDLEMDMSDEVFEEEEHEEEPEEQDNVFSISRANSIKLTKEEECEICGEKMHPGEEAWSFPDKANKDERNIVCTAECADKLAKNNELIGP